MNLTLLTQYALPGDFVLIGGGKPLQRLIQYGQKRLTFDGKPSRWSHAMLVYDENLFVESTIKFHSLWRIDNGVQFTKISEYAKAKRAVLIKPELTDEQRQEIIDRAVELESEGVCYPVVGLFWSLAAYYILGRLRKQKNFFSNNGLYCSAFIQDCYDVIGIDFTSMFGTGNTAPEHLWRWAIENNINKVIL